MTNPLTDFYKGKCVLVTGHTGVKGAWLSAWLLEMGAKVVGYALAPETDRPNLFVDAKLDQEIDSVIADLGDLEKLRKTCEDNRPDVILHLAAQSLVRRSYANPIETFQTNVLGTAHVLEAARSTPSVRACVIVTTDKCYENRETLRAYREDDALGGHDPYSASKGAAEIVTSSYRRSFFADDTSANIGSARAGNVIGGGDWAEDRLIPDVVRAIKGGTELHIRNPESVRPWQHLLEPLSGYLSLGQRLFESGEAFAEAWNFGPNDEDAVPVQQVLEQIQKEWPAASQLQIHYGPSDKQLHEANLLMLDSTKAKSKLNWQPKLNLEKAVSWTCGWYEKYLKDSAQARALLSEQIESYTSI